MNLSPSWGERLHGKPLRPSEFTKFVMDFTWLAYSVGWQAAMDLYPGLELHPWQIASLRESLPRIFRHYRWKESQGASSPGQDRCGDGEG